MAYDVAAVRAHFPALREGAAHFDGPGGAQVPDIVGDAVRETLTSAIANRGSVTAAERRAEEIVRTARRTMSEFLNAGSIVFGRSMTQLTYDFARTLAKNWRPGDDTVVLPFVSDEEAERLFAEQGGVRTVRSYLRYVRDPSLRLF